jgi:hypothetical protein
VYIAQVIHDRLEARDLGGLRAIVTGEIRTYALGDDRSRLLWKELTRDDITQAPCWREYKQHVARRNNILHRGVGASRDEASASLAAVKQMIEHLDGLQAD